MLMVYSNVFYFISSDKSCVYKVDNLNSEANKVSGLWSGADCKACGNKILGPIELYLL